MRENTKSGREADRADAAGWRRERLFRAPSWNWAQKGEIGWWVRPEWSEALIGPDGLRLPEWRADGSVTTVKQGPHRIVYRAELPGRGAVYVKHFLVPNFPSIFRQWVRRGKGRNEAKRAAMLAALGVPTITPIALGEQRRRRFLFENYLVTPEVPDSLPLDTFLEEHLPRLPEPRRGRLRRRLAELLGDLTARLHNGGALHTDFHPGNLLVSVTPEGEPRLAMIDLDALRLRPELRPRDAIENLSLLNQYFWIRSNRTDRCRFLRAYRRGRRAGLGDPKALARQIEAGTRDRAERLWARWGRRCLGTNKYFVTYQGDRAWSVAHRDLDPSTVRALMADADAPFARPDAVLLKDSRTTTVAEVPMVVAGATIPVIYKRFNRKKALDPFYALFRPSRAWRAWQNGGHLASRGLPTPKNLAVIGCSSPGRRFLLRHFLPHDTYLVTVKAEPSVTLFDFAGRFLASQDATSRRAHIGRLLPPLARLIRTLHERSLSHRDLKAANVLIEGPPDDARPSLTLIDLVGVGLEHPISHHHRVQNLARLQLSLVNVPGRTRTDSLRFLRLYEPRLFGNRGGWKPFWRDIERACKVKELRNRRNNRALS